MGFILCLTIPTLIKMSSKCSETRIASIFFFLPLWTREEPLASKFPGILRIASNMKAKNSNYQQGCGFKSVWSLLTKEETNQVLAMLHVLQDVFVPQSGYDTDVWIGRLMTIL